MASQGQGTRERIIEAAIEIIEAEGEVALRVDRVVEMAGFTKPVLDHHFHDRASIEPSPHRHRLDTDRTRCMALVD